jgi:quercetin dioxygenase-like cupin family protein
MKTNDLMQVVVQPGVGKRLNILGHTATIKLHRRETEGHYYVVEIITPSGVGIPPHVHDREDEMVYIIEGEFMITLGNENFNAGPGTEIFFPRNIPHAFQNIGRSQGKTLWTIVPGGNFEDFFEELNMLSGGSQDMGMVIEIFGNYGIHILINPPV